MEISKANGQLDAAFANLGQRASGVHQTYGLFRYQCSLWL